MTDSTVTAGQTTDNISGSDISGGNNYAMVTVENGENIERLCLAPLQEDDEEVVLEDVVLDDSSLSGSDLLIHVGQNLKEDGQRNTSPHKQFLASTEASPRGMSPRVVSPRATSPKKIPGSEKSLISKIPVLEMNLSRKSPRQSLSPGRIKSLPRVRFVD